MDKQPLQRIRQHPQQNLMGSHFGPRWAALDTLDIIEDDCLLEPQEKEIINGDIS